MKADIDGVPLPMGRAMAGAVKQALRQHGVCTAEGEEQS